MQSKISGKTATAIVIANMIGTGVFTSLGFQLNSITNTWSIIILWVLGAVMALCGALTYAELGTKLKRSGGEYHFLSEIYGKHVGFLSGWCSLIIGFSAPIALAAMASGAYMENYLGINEQFVATALVLIVAIFHSATLEKSSQFQNITTALKLLLMLLIVGVGWLLSSENTGFQWGSEWQSEIVLPSFAVSLIYVSYAFSGWNAAAYIADEIEDAKRNLPLALIGGTLVVSFLYIAMQLVFLKHETVAALQGQVEVGQIVATSLFGSIGGGFVSFSIALMLVSSISAMTWVGPRVSRVMAEDYQFLQFLGKTNRNNIPSRAIAFQTTISLIMIWTGSFEQVITYSAFVLQLFVALTVMALFIVRKDSSLIGFKSPLFPIPQIIFLGISLWILVYIAVEKTFESFIGVAILGVGSLLFYLFRNSKKESINKLLQ